jgi:hypothetical protein
VDLARDQLFPGAAFASDQNRRTGGGKEPDGIEDVMHGRANSRQTTQLAQI